MSHQASTSAMPYTAHRDYAYNAPLIHSESSAVIIEDSQLEAGSSSAAIDAYPYTASQINGVAAGGLTSDPTAESIEGQLTQQSSYTQTQPCASASQPPPNVSSCWGALIPVSKNPKCGRLDLDSIEPCLLHSVGRRPVFRDEQGYERANDLVIDDNRVSGVHFEIWREFVTTRDEEGNEKVQTIVRLRDLSSNGTFVRRQKVGKGNITILHDGVDVALNVTSDVETDEKGQEIRVPSYSWVFKYHNADELQKDAPPTLPHLMAMRYEILQVLGKGSFATVYRAVDRSTGEYRAIKIMNKRRFEKNPKTTMMLQREVAIMRGLKHRYIVSYIDGFEDDQYIFVVMELVEGGDLLDFVSAYGGLQEWQAIEIAYMVCEAIAYLHQRGVAHRDLKPENLLLTPGDNPVCKVTDFGLAKINTNSTFLRTMCGTPAYLAPEVVLQSLEMPGYSFAVDAWSIGVVIYACIVNSSPFPEPEEKEGVPPPDLKEQMKTRQIDIQPLLEEGVSDACIDFLMRFMTNNPAKRMTAYDALSHPWLAPAVRRRRATTSISALQRNPSGRVKVPAEAEEASTPAEPTSAQTERFWHPEDSQMSRGTPSLAHSEPHSHESSLDGDGPETQNHGNESPVSDAGSYSQRLGNLRLESDARASGEFDLDVGWRELPDHDRLMADYNEWQASQTGSPVKSSPESPMKGSQDSKKSISRQSTEQVLDHGDSALDPIYTPASHPMSVVTSQGIKRKAPGSAFSSDSSLQSSDSKPSLQNSRGPANETSETTPATSVAMGLSTSTQTAPLSPTSSLSSLSELSESQTRQSASHTSASRRAARQRNTSSRGKATITSRKSVRLSSVAMPSYAESDDEDNRKALASSKNSSTSTNARARSRKQRRLSTQPL